MTFFRDLFHNLPTCGHADPGESSGKASWPIPLPDGAGGSPTETESALRGKAGDPYLRTSGLMKPGRGICPGRLLRRKPGVGEFFAALDRRVRAC